MRRAKLIAGWVLLVWGGILFLHPNSPPPPTTDAQRYGQLTGSLMAYVIPVVGLLLVLSAGAKKPSRKV
jgi:hypothetical protein